MVPTKAAVNNLFCQAYCLEYLCTLVGLERGDTHLGHYLEDTFGYAFLVRGDYLVDIRVLGWRRVDRPAAACQSDSKAT